MPAAKSYPNSRLFRLSVQLESHSPTRSGTTVMIPLTVPMMAMADEILLARERRKAHLRSEPSTAQKTGDEKCRPELTPAQNEHGAAPTKLRHDGASE